MFRLILIFGFILFFGTIEAQTGYWEGFITQDGKRYAVNIYLKREGKKTIIGTASILIDQQVVPLELYGEIHLDRSINLWDTTLDDTVLPEDFEVFKRRYQFLYRRSIAGDTLKGHWQEVYNHSKVLHKQGLIELKEVKKKPKA